MSSHNTIAAGIATTRTSATDNPTTRAALNTIADYAEQLHPGTSPDDRAEQAAHVLSIAEPLNLLTTVATRVKAGHCTQCGKPKTAQDASPHTANPVGICTACHRGTRKTTTPPTITERA